MKSLPWKRKRLGKTNYRKRLMLLLANKPRLVVRKSLKNILAQIITYTPKGDKVIVSAHSKELEGFGWNTAKDNVPSAYLVGLLLGKKAKKHALHELVLDIGLQNSVKGSRVYSVLRGVIDSGLKVPHSPEILPKQERISGKHIAEYAAKLKKDPALYEKQFRDYLKKNVDPMQLPKYVEQASIKIKGG